MKFNEMAQIYSKGSEVENDFTDMQRAEEEGGGGVAGSSGAIACYSCNKSCWCNQVIQMI